MYAEAVSPGRHSAGTTILADLTSAPLKAQLTQSSLTAPLRCKLTLPSMTCHTSPWRHAPRMQSRARTGRHDHEALDAAQQLRAALAHLHQQHVVSLHLLEQNHMQRGGVVAFGTHHSFQVERWRHLVHQICCDCGDQGLLAGAARGRGGSGLQRQQGVQHHLQRRD